MMRRVLLAALVVGVAANGYGQAAPPATPPAAPAGGGSAGALNLEQETEALYSEAANLFQQGRFQDALAKIDLIKQKVSNRPFEKVLFVEGACYFNLNDYNKAAEVLQQYVEKFPDGENIHQVKMALGRSQISKGEPDKGIATLKEVVTQAPELKGEAGLIIAEHYKKENKPDEAIQILNSVIEGNVRSPEGIQAALMAADLYVAKGDVDKATALMESVKSLATAGDNVVQMNNLGIKLGDSMLERKSFREALAAYQTVRRKSEITRIQKERIAKIEQSLANPGKGPVAGTKEELETRLKSEQELLTELEKRTDYDASLYYRLGRCYFEMGRFWESILAFDMINSEFKEFPQRDRAVFGMIIANAQLKRISKARELCEKYISEFPDGADLQVVSEMYGMLAYEQGDLDTAEKSFDKAQGFPKADKERLLFLRGNVLFELQRFEDARTSFELLMKDFPKSAYMDDAEYRIALTYFYQNDYKNVMKSLKTYLEDNPKGQYVVDAKYRMAFIKFQGREVDDAMEDLQAIIASSPNDPNIGQVYALLGDGFNQKGQYDKALENFAIAVEKAQSDDVLNYAMENATDLYVGANKWKELAEMWEKYYGTHKDNEGQALKAILWISRARIRNNQPDEAKKLLSDAIKPKIGNAANEQVEGLIQQLVSLVAPKRRRVSTAPPPPATADGAAAKPAEPGAPAPVPAPQQITFQEVEKQLEELITPPQEAMNGTAQMRILFARAWLAKQMKEPDTAEKIFSVIIEVAKADDLSPMLLATVGDNARKKNDLEKAEACYKRLEEIFPDSEFADSAPVGLAEIAYEKGEFDKALELFNKAINDYAASSRLLDATLGKGKCLIQLKKFDEAKELYNQVANTKEWRGEATAIALYYLGQIEEAKKDYAAAIPYYQRVFIAHQKWKPWVAKSYLQAARCFVNLGKRDEAKKHLQEMTRRADLQKEPEMKEAQQELGKLG